MYLEIKQPFAYLTKGDSSVIFFNSQGYLTDNAEPVLAFDDIPCNYPRWAISNHTIGGAKGRIKDMVTNEGWDLVSTTENDLNSLKDLRDFSR